MIRLKGNECRERIEAELGIERRRRRQRRRREQEGAAVGGRLHHRLRAHRAAGAGAMLQDERPLGLRRQPVDQQPRRQVQRPARGVGHDHAHRAGGPFLRQRRCRDDREREHGKAQDSRRQGPGGQHCPHLPMRSAPCAKVSSR